MTSTNGTPRFDYEIHIGAPVARVWHALTDGDMTPHYAFGTRFEGRLVKGAPYAFIADGAFRAVDGGSVPRIRWIRGLGADPGHWWPAPAMVISSTVRPAGQEAVEVVTVPAVVATGTAQ